MNVLVTGGAGFIGAHTIKALMDKSHQVICIDDFNDYYDPKLKQDRINNFLKDYQFPVYRCNICDLAKLKKVFAENQIDKICHLAARAGVRASIENPFIYEEVDIKGTLNLLELAKDFKIKDFVFASSSSVYGGNTKIPFSEKDAVDSPISVYAAAKKAGELLCYTYHHLYKFNCTCLRFFTVYGPWGRPDMALYKFTENISNGRPIDVYNYGRHQRDFTYIDDIIQGIIAALDNPFPYEIINLGNSHSVDLNHFISCIEKGLGKSAKKNMLTLQPGDVEKTYADIDKAERLLGFHPQTNIETGVTKFILWYKNYYKLFK